MNHAASVIPAPRRTARLLARRRLLWIGVNAGTLIVGGIAGLLVRSVLLSGGGVSPGALDAARGRLESIVGEQKSLAEELRTVESRLLSHAEATQHPDWSILLAYISRVAGDEVALDELTLEPGEPPAAFTLAIRGNAVSQNAVTAFVLALEQSGVFTSTALLRSGRTPAGTYAFAITCRIGGTSTPTDDPTKAAEEGREE